MSLAARIQDLFRDRRNEERARLLITAHLRADGKTIRAVLLNLSRSGAMMAAVQPPTPGDHVTLVCEDLEAPASVIWVKGFQLGLAFERRLQQQQVDALIDMAGDKGRGR